MFRFFCRRSSLLKKFFDYKDRSVGYGRKSWALWCKTYSSYEMPLLVIKEFETESVITGYHAYMNDWKPILGENLSVRPEPEN